jgi:outer membrane scaffolding protein for murein synthesis (MipA/OmpV family)
VERSDLVVGSDGRGGGELVGLVDDIGGDLTELVTVLAGVVGAEQQLTARLELYAEVGLGSATVATVRGAQRGGVGGNCSCHIGLISSTASVSGSTY